MRKTLYSIIIFLLISLMTHAQTYDPSKINPKAVVLFNQAMNRAEDGNLVMAAGLLKQAVEQDDRYIEAYISLGGIYKDLKNFKTSVEYYEKAFAIDPLYTIDYRLPYSISLAGLGEFQKALEALDEQMNTKPPKNQNTLKAMEYRRKSYQFGVDYAARNENKNYVFAPINMGPSINSTDSEYFPSLTIDGSELVFTRSLSAYNEDFFYTKKKDTTWEKSKPMQGDVNTPQNEGAQNISQDGQWLVFTGCNRGDGFGSCDIYISFLYDNKWSEAQNLGGRVNTDQWESQPCLSPDKTEIYFASRRFGGYGGSDIYVTRLQSNDTWGEPENLGPQINTSGDEQCPFIHADNQTLYFTSNYWQGYGDEDLFYSRKGPGGDWSQPYNLGFPINTIGREGTLFIAADGKTAYYASDKSDSRGGMDIYTFELREDVRPFRTLWVKGKVFDKKTEKGLPSAVELIDLKTKKMVSRVQTDETGNYLVTLPIGKNYAFNVNRKGYLFYSDNFSLEQGNIDSVFEKNIPLQPLEVNASVVLNNIFFDINKYNLQPASEVELDKLVQLLLDNPTLRIEITGHTDNVGKPADNLALSNNRAKAVVNYLTSKGIKATRLKSRGLGETKPIGNNATEEGRATNRRTEMRVEGM